MIVSVPGNPTRRLGPEPVAGSWRCLARRGMLHSECESFEQVVLPANGESRHHAPGIEQALHVLNGTGALVTEEGSVPLAPGSVGLLRAGTAASVNAGPQGLELLVLRTLSARTRAALPARVPELPQAERSIRTVGGVA